eukprot:scaffold291638_cov14-Tisochrysis_lutea.AAC.1
MECLSRPTTVLHSCTKLVPPTSFICLPNRSAMWSHDAAVPGVKQYKFLGVPALTNTSLSAISMLRGLHELDYL